MCHNPGTWHNCPQVKLTSEESCQRTNCKTNYKLENQIHFGTIVPVSLGTIVPVSHGNNRPSVTWEQSCQLHLGTIVPISFGNNHATVTWERTLVPVLLENNRASVTSV